MSRSHRSPRAMQCSPAPPRRSTVMPESRAAPRPRPWRSASMGGDLELFGRGLVERLDLDGRVGVFVQHEIVLRRNPRRRRPRQQHRTEDDTDPHVRVIALVASECQRSWSTPPPDADPALAPLAPTGRSCRPVCVTAPGRRVQIGCQRSDSALAKMASMTAMFATASSSGVGAGHPALTAAANASAWSAYRSTGPIERSSVPRASVMTVSVVARSVGLLTRMST